MHDVLPCSTEVQHDPYHLDIGDWVIIRNRPELGIGVVTSVTYYQSGSKVWQVVHTDRPTWRGDLSQNFEKVGPPKSRSRQ